MGFNLSPYTATHESGPAKLKMLHFGFAIWVFAPKGKITGTRLWSPDGGRATVTIGGVQKNESVFAWLKEFSLTALIAQMKMTPAEKRRAQRQKSAQVAVAKNAESATGQTSQATTEPLTRASIPAIPYRFRVTRQQNKKERTGREGRRGQARRRR